MRQFDLWHDLRRLVRREDGAVFILLAVAIGVTLLATMMAVEFSTYMNEKSRFRNALDQAVIAAAAAGGTVHDVNTYALEYFKSNLPEGGANYSISQFVITSNADKTVWNGIAKATVKTTMAGILGINTLKLDHVAQVEWDNSTKTELVAMIDVSGTMCANFQRSKNVDGTKAIDFVPDAQCSKLHMVQKALHKITEIGVGYTNASGKDAPYAVGIVPFTYKVKVPNPSALPNFITDAEKGVGGNPNYFTDNTDVDAAGFPLPFVIPLKNISSAADKNNLLTQIDQLTSQDDKEFNRPFMKRSSLGAHISALMLDPRYYSVFGGVAPGAFGDPKTEKIVVMLTDSANLGCCFTNYPQSDYRNNYIYSYHLDHEHLVGNGVDPGICQQMKEAGIQIYTILLDVSENDANERGGEIVQAFEKCATSPQYAFRVPYGDEATLEEVYNIVGKALVKLRLTQ